MPDIGVHGAPDQLQWGRVPMNAEIVEFIAEEDESKQASMDGNHSSPERPLPSPKKMNPSKLQWGRVPMNAEIAVGGYAAFQMYKLQWGRVPMNAEMLARLRTSRHPCSLQWGRVPMNAEMPEFGSAAFRSSSFNGAAFR